MDQLLTGLRHPESIIIALSLSFFVVWVLVAVGECLVLSRALSALPERHRALSPRLVWLSLIPCADLVMTFIIVDALSRSFKGYFDEVGDTSVEDCGKVLGFVFAGTRAGKIAPVVNYLALPASFVLMIIYLVKVRELTQKISTDHASPIREGPVHHDNPYSVR